VRTASTPAAGYVLTRRKTRQMVGCDLSAGELRRHPRSRSEGY
jgi:hypothetical protein